MKLTIEIDLKDQYSCTLAVERLYEALVEHHGVVVTEHILHDVKYGHGYTPEAISRRKFLNVCWKLPDDDLRLVLEYYAMAKPSKRGLAVELAKRNETLPQWQLYCRGSRIPSTMLQQIRRIFRDNKDDCAVIGEASPVWRDQELRRVTEACALSRNPRFREAYRELTGRIPGHKKRPSR
jgi:hypothetical protein